MKQWLIIIWACIRNKFSNLFNRTSHTATIQQLVYAISEYDKKIGDKWTGLLNLIDRYEAGKRSKSKKEKLTIKEFYAEFYKIYDSISEIENQIVVLKTLNGATNAGAFYRNGITSNYRTIYSRANYRSRTIKLTEMIKVISHYDLPELTTHLTEELSKYSDRLNRATEKMDEFNKNSVRIPFALVA